MLIYCLEIITLHLYAYTYGNTPFFNHIICFTTSVI